MDDTKQTVLDYITKLLMVSQWNPEGVYSFDSAQGHLAQITGSFNDDLINEFRAALDQLQEDNIVANYYEKDGRFFVTLVSQYNTQNPTGA